MRKEEKDYLLLVIISVFLALALSTRFHDPYLHSFIAYLNGWELGAYSSGITTGSTEVFYSATKNVPSYSVWAFYMFPSMFIFLFVILITFIKTDKILLIFGVIITGLNLPSFDPSNKASDSYEAAMFLISRGTNETLTFTLHWLIFIGIIILWGLYLDVAIENDMRDARSRIKNIITIGK